MKILRPGLVILTAIALTYLPAAAQPKQVKLRPLEGYFLDNSVDYKKDLNFWVISDRRKFIKYFGWINKPDTPNFEFDHVLVMALPPSKKKSTLSFERVGARAGNFIEVYCSVKKNEYPLTYMSYPVVVAAIPRYYVVTRINFYDNATKKLLESVPIR